VRNNMEKIEVVNAVACAMAASATYLLTAGL
jgi:hypothetical protein